jgi:hypothetical protein
VANKAEEINALLSAAEYLSQEYITKKLLTILGDIDLVDEVMAQIADESMIRMSKGNDKDNLQESEDNLQESEENLQEEDVNNG